MSGVKTEYGNLVTTLIWNTQKQSRKEEIEKTDLIPFVAKTWTSFWKCNYDMDLRVMELRHGVILKMKPSSEYLISMILFKV